MCAVPLECISPPGSLRAVVFAIPRGGRYPEDATAVGEQCLADDAVPAAQPVLTRGRIVREFQRLAWPASRLLTQPPDGTTLVNLPTILRTTNTGASRRVVTLLGQQVTIEARPDRYVWQHGDGTSQTTTSPGHPYPRAGYRDVTHTYARAARGVRLSVDTVYVGRYRVGNGAWVPIDQPRTIAGPPTVLQVRTATPHLTGGDRR
ncbi:hypothetical protein K8Z61_14650 [Nocardioides sp. TRM66260-LWL]|uniref:hypothetical protein n=1 Tax=Nocardioides sp. TRM66260-LWL TaxID=2874478 RepID=UPI001CC64083|nr:hypothetical protein [Nocardioides sp. TRM66260-LWL]MBZ5735731.1 hypothetical protein [Nocardioides sp. TRM66260-LWL]